MKTQPLEFEKPIFELERKLEDLKRHSRAQDINLDPEVKRMEAKIDETKRETYEKLTAWQRVQIARHPQRPYALDYVSLAFTDFVELHGDRLFGDDKSMPGGLATIGDFRCVVVGHQKGRDLKENLKRNFGSAHPEGYRKALRLMRLGEKFGLPVIALIDTPGAYPGIGAEERHISEAIAVNLREMMILKTPIISVIIGEGGSGGALGIGVADRVLMLENAYYSVISPEGCAAILWKHRSHAPEAAEALKLTARDLNELKLIDEVVPEPLGGAHQDHAASAGNLQSALVKHLKTLAELQTDKLLAQRYAKFRKIGEFAGDAAPARRTRTTAR
ncbi:MAG: acetyl-CoA carboxylase carboxyl transferase subunit alpha [Chthoniobacter sp.]|nr:acetyl-CoA carboxylase carboxyl transferase subunit alpha [Chthoniobacter sp.]